MVLGPHLVRVIVAIVTSLTLTSTVAGPMAYQAYVSKSHTADAVINPSDEHRPTKRVPRTGDSPVTTATTGTTGTAPVGTDGRPAVLGTHETRNDPPMSTNTDVPSGSDDPSTGGD